MTSFSISNSSVAARRSVEAVARRVGTIFYLVEPKATTFRHADEVPNYINEAAQVYLAFTVLEFVVRWLVGRPQRLNEAFSSISCGILFESVRVLLSGAALIEYEWLYRYRLFDLPWDSLYTWLTAFVLVDFFYYWIHRAYHEVNILWALHQVHHGSEDFNFTTDFRVSIFQRVITLNLYTPLALAGIPLPAMLVHLSLNNVYQFWLHNTFIGKLGPLEWVIATPSFHRVHHGANNWCLDKNYTSVLVVWDHLFGTYEAEREDSEIVYGLTKQPQSHNAVYHQFFYFGEVFHKARSMPTWTDSLKALFYGPGWTPGAPRLGDPTKFPVIRAPRTKYDPQVPLWQLLYVGSHLAVTALIQQQLLARFSASSWVTVVAFLVFIIGSVGVVTAMLDGRRWAGPAEVVRCAVYLVNASVLFATHVPALDAALTLYFSLCTVFWTCHSLVYRHVNGKIRKTQ